MLPKSKSYKATLKIKYGPFKQGELIYVNLEDDRVIPSFIECRGYNFLPTTLLDFEFLRNMSPEEETCRKIRLAELVKEYDAIMIQEGDFFERWGCLRINEELNKEHIESSEKIDFIREFAISENIPVFVLSEKNEVSVYNLNDEEFEKYYIFKIKDVPPKLDCRSLEDLIYSYLMRKRTRAM